MTSRAFRAAAILSAFALFCFMSPPHLPVCGFRWITGRPCPFCGLTRAMFALAKGHFREAIHFHALSPLAAGVLIALVWNQRLPARVCTPLFTLFAAYGVWRILM